VLWLSEEGRNLRQFLAHFLLRGWWLLAQLFLISLFAEESKAPNPWLLFGRTKSRSKVLMNKSKKPFTYGKSE
jgi:hypothetical protein